MNMKKIVCLLVAMALCLSAAVFAESVPSKTTGDLTQFEVVAENLPADSGFFVRPVLEDEVDYQENVEFCQAEINSLVASKTISEYFGEVIDFEGNRVSLTEVLGSEILNVYEFCPVIAGNYEEEYGKVTVEMLFSTPYEKDEKVIVLIGIMVYNVDNTQDIVWFAFDGVGVEVADAAVEEKGCVQVELDPEIVVAIQEGTALLAVVSK